MADVTISSAVSGASPERDALHWFTKSPTIGYLAGFNSTSTRLAVWKSTDLDQATPTFTEQDTANAPANDIRSMWAYADWETAGLSGNDITFAYLNNTSSRCDITWFNTGNDQWSATVTQIVGSLTISGVSNESTLGCCRAGNGDYIVAFRENQTSAGSVYQGTDQTTFSKIGDTTNAWVGPSSTDQARPMPCDSSDQADFLLFYYDQSLSDYEVVVWDQSTTSWVNRTNIQGTALRPTQVNGMGWFDIFQHPTSKVCYTAYWTDEDPAGATADLETATVSWDGSTLTITAKANVITDTDDCYMVALCFDSVNGAIYVIYIGKSNGSETWGTTVGVYWRVSTDLMTSWGNESQDYVSTQGDHNYVSNKIITVTGGRVMPAVFNDATPAIFVNDGQDVAIAPAADSSAAIIRRRRG